MKRVVAEVPRRDLPSGDGDLDLGFVERLRIVHLLHFTPRSYSGVFRVKFARPTGRPSQMVGRKGFVAVHTLARLDDGAFLAYFEGRPAKEWAGLAGAARGLPSPTLELTPDSWRISVVGTTRRLRSYVKDLRRERIHHHVLSVGGADLPADSPLEWLTPRQREALVAAYRSGYFDTPRRASSARVAKSLHLGKSATVEHLRKAQKRLLDGLIWE